MLGAGKIRIYTNKENVEVDINSILYVQMSGNYAHVHVTKDRVYQTRMTFSEFEDALGNYFVKVKRGCLVSPMAIHDVVDKIDLCTGEMLDYVTRKKKEVLSQVLEKKEKIFKKFDSKGIPSSREAYRRHYNLFEKMPFAFADIEMVFDKRCHAVDWIFRYGNQALADLEKVPLKDLVGSSFGQLFPNMDAKWLRSYERATLYGENLRIVDYSAEIDKYLDVICFPTFNGHCGCILFDIDEINSVRRVTDTERALSRMFEKMLRGK